MLSTLRRSNLNFREKFHGKSYLKFNGARKSIPSEDKPHYKS